MDIRALSPLYAVSPQIEPQDMTAIAEAGFVAVIDNRPDGEIPPGLRAATMRAAAAEAGLGFVELPVTHDTLGPDLAAQQRAAMDEAGGPVLAYCASGTRCTIVWMLGHAESTPPDELLAAARAAGYDLGQVRPTLEHLYRG
ncbi:MAG: TIGR01244 family sulfur transferase [Pseudomonadota bacterium]